MNEHETNARVCSVCGRDESAIASELVEIDGELYCEDCAHAEGYARCADCGEWYDADDLPLNIGGELLCEDCAHSAGWEVCEDCGEWVSPGMQVVIDEGTCDEKTVCLDCCNEGRLTGKYFKCYECGEYSSASRRYGQVAGAYGSWICDDCADEYDYCEGCGGYVRNGEAYYDDDTDCRYCESCWDAREEDGGRYIHEYGYKPDPYFFYTDEEDRPRSTYSYSGSQLTFGLELEVDKGNDRGGCARDVHDEFDDLVYMKSDSSVDFEIVTHPCTLDYHRIHFDWPELCSIPPRYGYKSHDAHTCGLHIHVGRAQLGNGHDEQQDTIAKVILLMYRHWDALVQFSRRSSTQLDRWASKPDPYFGSGVREKELRSLALDSVEDNRYFALNTCNRSTIEFRLWNGSLRPDTVLATIELTSNICRYAMSATFREVCESKWTDITNFAHYAELDTYLEERGLLTDDAYKPSEIKIREENTPPVNFHIGDRVRIVRQAYDHSYLSPYAVEERPTGTIVARNSTDPVESWAIRFDEYHCYGHSCNGLTPAGYGYYVRPECIELVNENDESAITVGTEVELRRDSMYYGSFVERGAPLRGRVVVEKGALDGRMGVYFPGLTFGHSLDGALPAGDAQGWWVARHELMRVESNAVSA